MTKTSSASAASTGITAKTRTASTATLVDLSEDRPHLERSNTSTLLDLSLENNLFNLQSSTASTSTAATTISPRPLAGTSLPDPARRLSTGHTSRRPVHLPSGTPDDVPATHVPFQPISPTSLCSNGPAPHPPPPSPASPVLAIPSSVKLPPQPNSTPADRFFRTHSMLRRPDYATTAQAPLSPPVSEANASGGGHGSAGASASGIGNANGRDRQTVRVQSSPSSSSDARSRSKSRSNGRRVRVKTPSTSYIDEHAEQHSSHQAYSTRPAAKHSQTQLQVQAQPAQAQLKRNKKFFLSSPTSLDSDEDAFPKSIHGRLSKGAASSNRTMQNGARVEVAGQAQASEEIQDDDDDDAYEDVDDDEEGEDDESGWSSEDDDEHVVEPLHAQPLATKRNASAAAILSSIQKDAIKQAKKQAEEEKDREMFAKRTPSQVNIHRSGLSYIFAPLPTLDSSYDTTRPASAVPAHLRSNRSAVELSDANNRRNRNAPHLTVPGGNGRPRTLQTSKSAAAIPTLANGSARPGQLRPTASGNGLTRLGGMPSGVELSSDEEDSEDDAHNPLRNNSKVQSRIRERSRGRHGSAGSNSQGSSGRDSLPRSLSSAQRLAGLMGQGMVQTSDSVNGRRNSSSPTLSSHPPGAPVSSIAPPVVTMRNDVYATTGDVIFTPRTTRRQMLASELTESLRTNLLMERRSRTGLAMPNIGGMVAAVGSRLTGRNNSPTNAQTQVQKGDAKFTVSQEEREHSFPYKLPPLPRRPSRSTSEPQVPMYYSPGFHHV
ncbi:hypothetical protein EMMF5_003139 [Cystobasidiomycetes sp. EMM_F5]